MMKKGFIRDTNQEQTLLQQKVIHLNAELMKYKYKVKEYQENYHINLIDALRCENQLLIEQVNHLKSGQSIQQQECEEEEASLIEQLEAKTAIIEQFQSRIEAYESAEKSYKEIVCRQEAELNSLRTTLAETVNELNGSTQELDKKDKEIIRLGKLLEETAIQSTNNYEKLSETEIRLSEFSSILEETEHKCQELTVNADKLALENTALKGVKDELLEKIEELRKDLHCTKGGSHQSRTESKAVDQREVIQFMNDFHEVKLEVADLEEMIRASLEQINFMEAEVARLTVTVNKCGAAARNPASKQH